MSRSVSLNEIGNYSNLKNYPITQLKDQVAGTTHPLRLDVAKTWEVGNTLRLLAGAVYNSPLTSNEAQASSKRRLNPDRNVQWIPLVRKVSILSNEN